MTFRNMIEENTADFALRPKRSVVFVSNLGSSLIEIKHKYSNLGPNKPDLDYGFAALLSQFFCFHTAFNQHCQFGSIFQVQEHVQRHKLPLLCDSPRASVPCGEAMKSAYWTLALEALPLASGLKRFAKLWRL